MPGYRGPYGPELRTRMLASLEYNVEVHCRTNGIANKRWYKQTGYLSWWLHSLSYNGIHHCQGTSPVDLAFVYLVQAFGLTEDHCVTLVFIIVPATNWVRLNTLLQNHLPNNFITLSTQTLNTDKTFPGFVGVQSCYNSRYKFSWPARHGKCKVAKIQCNCSFRSDMIQHRAAY